MARRRDFDIVYQMKCPTCQQDLVDIELEPGLPAKTCQSCHGTWIAGVPYLGWVESSPSPSAAGAPVASTSSDSGAGLRCPECGHFLHRAAVSAEVGFTVHRCRNCAGFWLDAGEWDSLKSQGLAQRLHHIFSDVWQHKLAAAQRHEQEEKLWAEKLGDDIAEARRVRQWIQSHPRKQQLIAYIMEHEAV